MAGISMISPGPFTPVKRPRVKTTALSYSLKIRIESANKIKIKTIMGSYIMEKKQNTFAGGYGCSSMQVVKDFVELRREDIVIAKAFMKDMIEIK